VRRSKNVGSAPPSASGDGISRARKAIDHFRRQFPALPSRRMIHARLFAIPHRFILIAVMSRQ
jgi:hypothetical protein